MNLLQQMLLHKRSIIDMLAIWASVRGMEEIKRRCCELSDAINDEIERLDKVDGTKEEIRAIDEEIDEVLPRDDLDY